MQWEVVQKGEVILNAGEQKMYLYFNEAVSSFETIDRGGQKASGKLIFGSKDDLSVEYNKLR